MKKRTWLASMTLAGALLLAGCSASLPGSTPTASSPAGEGAATAGDAPSKFLACLTAAGVDAKLTAQGQVAVKSPTKPDPQGGAISSSSDDGILGLEVDDAGNQWIIPIDASGLADDVEAQDAYAGCEAKYPDFAQPQGNQAQSPEIKEQLAKEEEAALAFAACARENGYTDFEDPDFSMTNAVMIPDGFTEAEFRDLLRACWDDKAQPFGFGATDTLSFEPWAIIEEFQNGSGS